MESNAPEVYSSRGSNGDRARDLSGDEAPRLLVRTGPGNIPDEGISGVDHQLDAAVGNDRLGCRNRRCWSGESPDASDIALQTRRWRQLVVTERLVHGQFAFVQDGSAASHHHFSTGIRIYVGPPDRNAYPRN